MIEELVDYATKKPLETAAYTIFAAYWTGMAYIGLDIIKILYQKSREPNRKDLEKSLHPNL